VSKEIEVGVLKTKNCLFQMHLRLKGGEIKFGDFGKRLFHADLIA
jgi:hypothetical protein